MNDYKNSQFPIYLYHEGTNYFSYRLLGAHPASDSSTFRVWAPHAAAVHVVGDFNEWQESDDSRMKKITDGGVWEISIPSACAGQFYKYLITTPLGNKLYKSDPYAFSSQTKENTASIIYDFTDFSWHDQKWQDYKKSVNIYNLPINIYELNLSSWRRNENGSLYTYEEITPLLISYIKEQFYTHIELMPMMEYPFDGSWGYQVSGYFAPTRRFGPPEGLKYLIDECHRNGIGVILDWVPAHFPKDSSGLYRFDGSYCYEYKEAWQRENKGWGTHRFDFGRPEVKSFLISNALYWLDIYHADGLRTDAVSSMLYLDYDKEPGEWMPNIHGGNENLEAIEFLKDLNKAVFQYFPNTMMIAEESTAWPMVTKPVYLGGLGFNFKWNMGWMNDMLDYMQTDPWLRKYRHNNITFSFHYAFSENFILPLSHDEVVHGKKSILDKMPGTYEEKFANARLLAGYMMAHPGKKLNFMGYEIGQFSEWNYEKEVEWFLLQYDYHKKLNHYIRALNEFYLKTPPLWEIDFSWEGFSWISNDDFEQNIIAFIRKDKAGTNLIVAANFSPVERSGYLIGALPGKYKEVFNTNSLDFGGTGTGNAGEVTATPGSIHGYDFHVSLLLPPLSIIFLLHLNTPASDGKGGIIYEIK
ncbi:1,4-alpha-glucan branching protein GlgB [Parasporobacterium paucivorans]|uniref:1,4-alpha-glucan branching enzyme GlgB n=1 Tax=Parasporobacterium paucivorans DSM 15970 TaxID=1122934 RepID=A0A1M6G5W3_9FIRM|nr:1,4-alpha-glucan branching protein GlgB [Parasporobacterium paucivorans]SHJ05331.1 1,4-alpha-glucan branching enzyme [Parasporobacterium paucivorans DSM 15970]